MNMEQETNNIQLNNQFDPLPKPLPEENSFKRNGGFKGAKNRYCSDETPEPVTKMPDFTIGDENLSFNDIEDIKSDNKFNPPKEKGKSTGMIIFVTVVATAMILTGAFLFFFVSTGNNNNSQSNSLGSVISQDSTSQEVETFPNDLDAYFDSLESSLKKSSTEETEDKTNKNWKGIPMKSTPSEKTSHSAQTAFNKVSDSTVAVLCYNDKITDIEDACSQGTGTIISSDGYIVTNSHVIGDSKTAYKYQVIDQNNKKYTATVVGYDTRTDIAVIKIEGKNFKSVTFGKSTELSIGEDIITVGNPGGLEFQNSLTKGVVSAKNRSFNDSTVKYIQIDAAINPGSSGGSLCNLYGQVVGITTAKLNSTLYENMAFVIPSETVKKVADDIITQGYVSDRVRIGLTGIAVNSYTSAYYNLPNGILITEISENGSLAGTKVQPKDVLTKVNGKEVSSFNEVYTILDNYSPKDKVSITLYRPNGSKGETYTITITLVADNGESQQ
jgi:serine protease Do